MRRSVMRALIIAFLLVTVVGLGLAFYLRSKQAQRTGELALAGLEGDVTVVFDSFAIPHIAAKGAGDAFYALGYLHAQDRLFQIEMMRRIANGNLAEIVGIDALAYDKFFRSLGLGRAAVAMRSHYEEIAPQLISQVEAYVAGMNAFLQDGALPIEFVALQIPKREFSAADVFAIAGYVAFTFTKSTVVDPLYTYIYDQFGQESLAAFLPGLKVSRPRNPAQSSALRGLVHQFQSLAAIENTVPASFAGSNAWVLSSSRSRSGLPILANDPHIKFSSPSIFYESYLEYPGFALYGHYVPGLTFPLLGHGHKHGWAITMLQIDDMQLYFETLHPHNSFLVRNGADWQPVKERQEIIRVKGEQDHTLIVREGPRGPFIHEVVETLHGVERPVSISWAFTDSKNPGILGFYELSKADTLDKARKAASKIHAPGVNVVYANTEGDIAWWAAGRFPRWSNATGSRLILDGSRQEDMVQGYYPFSWNPSLENPSNGVIVSANQSPFPKPRRTSGFYSPNYRFDRLHKLLATKERWSAEECLDLQLDTSLEGKRPLLKKLLALIAPSRYEASSVAARALAILASWDYRHDKRSLGASIFSELYVNLIHELFAERLGEVFYQALTKAPELHEAIERIVMDPASPWWSCEGASECRKRRIRNAFELTITRLTEQLGADPSTWEWGRRHFVEHKHFLGKIWPLNWFFNVGPFPVDGASEVVNAMSVSPQPGILHAHAGPATRRVIDFGQIDVSWGINPSGQAGYFANHHYRDQAHRYVRGESREQIFGLEHLLKSGRKPLILRASRKL